MQLERILHSQGFGTRKLCRVLVRSGRVQVNGQVCEDPFENFVTDRLQFSVDGQPWLFQEKCYVMLNKPAGYECSHKTHAHPSIYTLLPAPLRGRDVQSIGRLDEDTTGLLLFSDDGQFIHRMASPKWKIAKVYEVTTKHDITQQQIDALLQGVQLHDEPTTIAALECVVVGTNRIHLTLGEGRYHQVKRMVGAAGNRVEKLRRIAMGPLVLPEDLSEGAWRWLTQEELASLLNHPKNSL